MLRSGIVGLGRRVSPAHVRPVAAALRWKTGKASGTPGRGAGKGQGVSSAHKQGPPKTTYSTEDLHRGLYLLAKQRLLDMKVDLKTVEDLKGLCHPDRVVENICRKATSGDFDEDFNPEEMADYPEDDKEFMKFVPLWTGSVGAGRDLTVRVCTGTCRDLGQGTLKRTSCGASVTSSAWETRTRISRTSLSRSRLWTTSGRNWASTT